MVTYHNFYTHNNLVSLAGNQSIDQSTFSNVGFPSFMPSFMPSFSFFVLELNYLLLAIDKKAGNHNLRASHRLASSIIRPPPSLPILFLAAWQISSKPPP